MAIASPYAVMVTLGLTGCNWVFGLDHVDPPDDGNRDAVPSSDALPFQDCRGRVTFVEDTALFPGFPAVANPTIRGDFQEAYDVESDINNGVDIHRWISDGGNFTAGDASALSSLDIESDPALSADGLELVFISSRDLGVNSIWTSERTSADLPWETPVQAPGLAGFVAGGIALSADGLTLYIVDGANELYQAERPGRRLPFVVGQVVAHDVIFPTVSADGLELISEINPTDTMVGLFEQVRGTTLQPFEGGEGLTQIMLPGAPVFEADLSPDNHVLLTGNQRFFVRSCPQ